MKIVNIAFYYFFEIPEPLEPKRVEIKELCLELGLRGTVIIATEGINMMVAGEREPIEKFKSYVTEMIGEEDLFFKESFSDYIPFKRMLVKAKQQTIPLDDRDLDLDLHSPSHLEPEELKKWYDEHRDFLILDTRNRFEYDVGTFENAIKAEIDNFRDFEDYLKQVPAEWKEKEVVTFCTGGIRCEKVVPLMQKHGFKKVHQLNGGILNYFEKVGGKHWNGDCFVFDRRIALNPELKETDHVECYNCRHPVTPAEQELDTYEPAVSCPHCYEQEATA